MKPVKNFPAKEKSVLPSCSLLGLKYQVWPRCSLFGLKYHVWPHWSLFGLKYHVWPHCSLLELKYQVGSGFSLLGMKYQPIGGEVPNVATLQPVWLFGINGIIKKKQIESNSMNSFICRRSSRKQLPEWMKDYVSLFAVNFFGNSEYKPLNTLNIVGKTE